MRVSILIIAILLALIAADQFYFKDLRESYAGGSISEGFVRKGSLGEILRQNDLLEIADDSQHLAARDMCAIDNDLKGFDYHNQVRLRFKIVSRVATPVRLRLAMPKVSDESLSIQDKLITLDPKRFFYSYTGHIEPETPVIISVNIENDFADAQLFELTLDGPFGRSIDLLKNWELAYGKLTNMHNEYLSRDKKIIGTMDLNGDNRRLILRNPLGIPKDFFAGTFPGKKNQGFCEYQAPALTKQGASRSKLLPEVNLSVSQQNLYGPDGILQNRKLKGRRSEVTADFSVAHDNNHYQQRVGLRFHGGHPGRRKDINAYRIYARKDYGKDTIPYSAIFDHEREIDLRTIVFKYTYQSYFNGYRSYFNPFNHSLALDIATAIGAIVPSHRLVNLSVNGKNEGVFLAMEHLSDRTVEHWLGHDDFVTVTYKKDNPLENRHQVSRYMEKIQRLSGEESYLALQEHYNVDNVINSVLLSAYIADDDFCQGMEVLDVNKEQIVTINWDLDHAFIQWDENMNDLKMIPHYQGFEILKPERAHLCTRSRVYSWVYSQSAEFRRRVRERLTYLLEHQLSPTGIDKMVEPYRLVNEQYFDNSKQSAIEDLQQFASLRPAVLLKELDELESRYQNQQRLSQAARK